MTPFPIIVHRPANASDSACEILGLVSEHGRRTAKPGPWQLVATYGNSQSIEPYPFSNTEESQDVIYSVLMTDMVCNVLHPVSEQNMIPDARSNSAELSVSQLHLSLPKHIGEYVSTFARPSDQYRQVPQNNVEAILKIARMLYMGTNHPTISRDDEGRIELEMNIGRGEELLMDIDENGEADAVIYTGSGYEQLEGADPMKIMANLALRYSQYS